MQSQSPHQSAPPVDLSHKLDSELTIVCIQNASA